MHLQDKEIESKINEYDMSAAVQRFADEQSIPHELALSYEKELKRYFFMCSAYKKHYGMAGKVDELWHTFIIYTKEYTNFCDAAFGTYFHHVPEPALTPENNRVVSMLHYVRFLIDYFRHYKELPPNEIWPLSMQLLGEQEDWDIQLTCIACKSACTTCRWEINPQ